MKPESIGRVLGIGLRVAGRMAGNAIMGETAGEPKAESIPVSRPALVKAKERGRAVGQSARGVGSGVGGFLRPFRNVGGKILLEVIGVFFLLPVAVFAPVLWRTRMSWQHGPDHRTFLSAAAVSILFLYLGASSFWRAWKR